MKEILKDSFWMFISFYATVRKFLELVGFLHK